MWFELPVRLLGMYLQMLPRLRAEESMTAVVVGQLAGGHYNQQDADEIWQGWRKIADPDRVDEPEELDAFWI